MAASPPFTYDEATATLVWPVGTASGWSVDTARALGAALRSGAWQGRPVRRAAVDFADAGLADAQGAAAEFLGLEVRVAGAPRGAGARFAVRDDFGID